MAGHQLVGVHAAGKRPDAIEPRADRGKLRPAYAELVGPVQVAAQRKVGDRRLASDNEGTLLQVQVEDDERPLDPPAQELGDRRLAGFLKLNEKTQRGDVARE